MEIHKKQLSKGLLIVTNIVFVVLVTTSLLYCDKEKPSLDVPFEGTHPDVVKSMLEIADTNSNDVLYDLGSGDGRIVIMAAQQYNIKRGVGFEIDPQRIEEANFRREQLNLMETVFFYQKDIFKVNFENASILTLYLLDRINLKLRPKILMDTKPGTRIVSHAFHMSDWEPDDITHHKKARKNKILKWIVPASAGGTWRCQYIIDRQIEYRNNIEIMQTFQTIKGSIIDSDSNNSIEIYDTGLNGKTIHFFADLLFHNQKVNVHYKGEIENNIINGVQIWHINNQEKKYQWYAKRDDIDVSGIWSINVDSEKHQLDGFLTLNSNDSPIPKAYYDFNINKSRATLEHVYVWGTSIYLRLPVGKPNDYFVLTGSLNKMKGSGFVELPKYFLHGQL
ncbi:MAG: Putative RNA methylase [Candidatus Magnetoglobus multicellularis str. Araruama]|uniref:RNA methylase n=1 Tax=Candidatus Magnetoglobus multicellularis str. Araruama TaxID=890399 RepID=A0A1V1PAZ7_9BACT|nr:MAG: Putative RNA methylase [Candidatus Magnetoglobus multicellularis str. Araruama]